MKDKSNKKLNAPLGSGLIIVSSFFYASYAIFTKLMGDFFSGYTAAAIRSLIIVITFGTFALFSKKLEPLKLHKNWLYILGLFITSLFIWGPLYYSTIHAGIGITTTVAYASILTGMFFFGWWWNGEKLTKDKVISAILGIVGILLIFSPTISYLQFITLGGALISGLSTAANAVISKKIQYHSTQATLIVWVTSVFANALMALALGKTYPAFHGEVEWFYLFMFAVVSLLASWTLVKGVKLIDAGTAGILGLLEIVFGVLFGIVLFSEKPAPIVLIGMGIILVSAAIPYLKIFKFR